MKRLILIMLAACSLCAAQAKPKIYKLAAPDGKLVVTVSVDDVIRWSVEDEGRTVLAPSQIAMQIGENETWGLDPRVRRVLTAKVDAHAAIPRRLCRRVPRVRRCRGLPLRVDPQGRLHGEERGGRVRF